ncbi:MAG TPA: BatA domain-containing protein, partial [Gammaproteobacteria bacterium]|nr:BatA domain-containing protein [Gammaproteobacteria bacterium]
MTLLAPLFLLGIAAIALPLFLHRLQVQSPDREPFSSGMFLLASEQRVHLQKRLRYLLLLALRIALLAVLAITFAGPVLRLPERLVPGAGPVLYLVVIDASFSMQADGRFDQALTEARTIIQTLPPGDKASILLAGSTITSLAEAQSDRAALETALAALEPGAGRLDLGELMETLEDIIREAREPVALHIVSDFQETGTPARFSDLVPERTGDGWIGLKLHPVANGTAANRFISGVRRDREALEVSIRSRGIQTGGDELRLAIAINGENRQEQSQPAMADGETLFRFQDQVFARGDNRVIAELLNADPWSGDNRYYAVIDNSDLRPVLVLTADPDSRAVTYIETALATGLTDYRAEAVKIQDLDPRILGRYSWVIVEDLGVVNDPLAAALAAYLDDGGAILAALGERALARRQVPVGGQSAEAAGLASLNGKGHTIARIDASHPALKQGASWRHVNVSNLFEIEAGDNDRGLVFMDDGHPFLLEHHRGAGKMLLLASSLDNIWNDLPVHPVFVGFLTEAGRYLGGEDGLERQRLAGARLILQQSGYASGQVIDPQGKTALTLADTRRSQEIPLNRLGFYQVYTPGRERLIAVNPDPRESEPDIMTEATQQSWQDSFSGRE